MDWMSMISLSPHAMGFLCDDPTQITLFITTTPELLIKSEQYWFKPSIEGYLMMRPVVYVPIRVFPKIDYSGNVAGIVLGCLQDIIHLSVSFTKLLLADVKQILTKL